jgi:hypothetical protein
MQNMSNNLLFKANLYPLFKSECKGTSIFDSAKYFLKKNHSFFQIVEELRNYLPLRADFDLYHALCTIFLI